MPTEKTQGRSLYRATHHFDLINWYLEADPLEVSAFGQLKNYGQW